MNPLVSVLVPIYGVENFIERCARSLFNQTYKNLEYIFVDDSSPDKSIQILRCIMDQYPEREKKIKIIRHERNRGLGAARNTAVENSNGQFVVVVDSDDWLCNDAIELLVNKHLETNADLVRGAFFMDFATNSEVVKFKQYPNSKEYCLACLSKLIPINIWGQLIRRDLYVNYDIHVKEGCNMGEDFQVTPLLAYYSTTVAWVDTPLYHYDCSNISSYTHRQKESNMRQILLSLEMLNNFFYDKGENFKNALKIAEAQIVAENIVSCCRSSIKGNFWKNQIEKARVIDKTHIRSIKKNYKIVYLLKNTPRILDFIIHVGDYLISLKRFFKGIV